MGLRKLREFRPKINLTFLLHLNIQARLKIF